MTLIRHPTIKSFLFDTETSHLKLDPKDPNFYQAPHLAYEMLYPLARFIYWEDYGFWCALGFDDTNGLLRNRDFGRVPIPHNPPYRKALVDFDRLEKYSLLEMEPPNHTLLRKRINRAFISRQIETLRPQIEAYAQQLIRQIDASQPFDLIQAFSMPLPVRVIAEMLGIDPQFEQNLLDWSHVIVKIYTRTQTHAETIAANKAAKDFAAFIAEQIAHKRAHPAEDLLSLLCVEGENALTDDEIISTAVLLLNAGHEATVHQTSNAVALLLEHNAWNDDNLGSDALISATLEECIRLSAPLHMFTRIAHRHVELMPNLTLDQGQMIGLLLGAANRDPHSFTNAKTFAPQRADQRNVTFGAGLHFCIGAPLARLEMQIALKTLYKAFPKLSFAAPPVRSNSYHFHGFDTISLVFDG